MPIINSFDDDRQSAAGLFAQTMLVVDDEAVQSHLEEVPEAVTRLSKPSRARAATNAEKAIKVEATDVPRGNALDAKKLIEKALDLGIVCSVLRVAKSDRSAKRLVKAAKNADIVSLDWEIEGDDGDLACEIIAGIVRSDIQQNGRVRLISIYTAMRNRQAILRTIRGKLNSKFQGNFQISDDCVTNKNTSGAASLRIVCLLKAHGIE